MYHKPLEQQDRQGRHADRKTENNAGDCIRIEWEARLLSGKESWSGEERETVG